MKETIPAPALPAKRQASAAAFAGFFVVFWLLILVVLRSQPLNDPGALWHVKVGEWIVTHHKFSHTDPFTWSHADKPWVPQQWGAECLIYLAHHVGGFDALLALMAAILAATAAAIAKRFLDGGLHWLPAGLIVAFGMAVAGFHFYLRPHIATIALMALVMMWLVDFDRGRIGELHLALMIPLCALWTNLHGGVLGGIFTYGLALAGWQLARPPRLRSGGLNLPPILLAAIVLVPCLLATLLNPFGIEMHRTWLSILGSSVVKETIVEHQPLNLARTEGQAVAAFGVFYLVMLAGTLPRRPRITWLIPVVWLALSVNSIRHGPLFCVTALVALADLLPETIWFRLLKKYGDTFARAPVAVPARVGWVGWAVPCTALAVAFSLQAARVPAPVVGHGWAQFDHKLVPVELVEPLQEYAKTRPEGFPIFNDANLGGFVIYFAPSLKVYMDDRAELYGDAGLRDYIDLANDHPERVEELADRAGFDRALVAVGGESDSVLYKYLKGSPRWREVAQAQCAALFERVK
jgi:hypothetical protein